MSASVPARRRRALRTVVAALIVGVAVTMCLGGWGHATTTPATAAVTSVSTASASGDVDVHVSLPAGFTAAVGYQPAVRTLGTSTELVSPRGGCSSPFGATPFDFDLACKHHDLGYDVLRYSARRGHPLGPTARAAIDDQFGHDLRAQCSQVSSTISNDLRRAAVGTACQGTAVVYLGSVDLNSWRQGWGPPTAESPRPWVAAGAMGLVAAAVGALVLTGHAGHKRT